MPILAVGNPAMHIHVPYGGINAARFAAATIPCSAPAGMISQFLAEFGTKNSVNMMDI
ncbi:hypothetical protein [Paracoccus simplex]|uniref:Uncharacterized protein n=1 Tax=Paracoccus simplex TaxID=2086346 RepID=A0ABV7S0W1_9RHOB